MKTTAISDKWVLARRIRKNVLSYHGVGGMLHCSCGILPLLSCGSVDCGRVIFCFFGCFLGGGGGGRPGILTVDAEVGIVVNIVFHLVVVGCDDDRMSTSIYRERTS